MVLLLTLLYTKGTEAQRGEAACPRSHSYWMAEPGLELKEAGSRGQATNHCSKLFQIPSAVHPGLFRSPRFLSAALGGGGSKRLTPWGPLACKFLSQLPPGPADHKGHLPASSSCWEPPRLRLRETGAESWPQLHSKLDPQTRTHGSTSQKFIRVSVHSLNQCL